MARSLKNGLRENSLRLYNGGGAQAQETIATSA
jgi:hypothetical protein